MKKAAIPLAPDSFEAACHDWEQRLKDFIDLISDGSIPALRGVQWTYEKRRVFVCTPSQDGKKKRGACGPYFHAAPRLYHSTANAVWRRFKQFAAEHGLQQTERLRNNEKELGWYDFRASDPVTEDGFSCQIDLPGEWGREGIHLSAVVGPRYRNEDLQV